MLVIAILKINKMAAPGTLTFRVSREHRHSAGNAEQRRAWWGMALYSSPSARERFPVSRTSSLARFPRKKCSSCRCGPARTVTASSWNRDQKGCSLSHRDELPSQGDKVRQSCSVLRGKSSPVPQQVLLWGCWDLWGNPLKTHWQTKPGHLRTTGNARGV